MYKIATLSSGGKPVVAPEKGYRADVDAILARVTPKTKIVFLANPNNPTGTYIPHDEVRRLHKGLPATRCWCWTRPTASTCAATTTRRGWSWSPPPTTR